jgi:hypothetical protein
MQLRIEVEFQLAVVKLMLETVVVEIQLVEERR